jgi:hypothetical protein
MDRAQSPTTQLTPQPSNQLMPSYKRLAKRFITFWKRSLVTVELQGGLGNQMFQAAAAYAHARRNKARLVLNLDFSNTRNQGRSVSAYRNTLFNFTHDPAACLRCTSVYKEPCFSFRPIPHVPNQKLVGYFQSEKYFARFGQALASRFRKQLKSACPNECRRVTHFLRDTKRQHRTQTVVVHVRRGDYLLRSDYHPPLSLDYYRAAQQLLEQHFAASLTYITVSDDPAFCREALPKEFHLSPFTDEISDLLLCANADHVIMANSSFSWWGAYLNPNDQKTVIAPRQWFGPLGPKDTDDLIPPVWIRL